MLVNAGHVKNLPGRKSGRALSERQGPARGQDFAPSS